MAHYLDHVIASELSYQVLERQRRESEITRTHADQGAGLTHLSRPIPVIKFWNAGEEVWLDEDGIDQEITPVWHYRGKK